MKTRNFRNIHLTALLFFIVSGCTSSQETTQRPTYVHTALGSERWQKVMPIPQKVLFDASANDLRVRVVESTSYICPGWRDHIEIDGPINDDTLHIVKAAFDTARPVSSSCTIIPSLNKNLHGPWVYLNSTGGSFYAGLALGTLFREKNATTTLIGDQHCSSACALAFLGGQHRFMDHDSKIMLHAPYKKIDRNIIDCNTEEMDKLSLEVYLIEMLESAEAAGKVYEKTMSVCSKKNGWTLNSDAAFVYGITTKR